MHGCSPIPGDRDGAVSLERWVADGVGDLVSRHQVGPWGGRHLECCSSLTGVSTVHVHVPYPQTPNTTYIHAEKTHNLLFIYKLEAAALCSRMT